MGVGLIGGGGSAAAYSDDLTATAAFVLKGKTYMGNDTNDDAGTGTMPNIGKQTGSVAPGGSVTISKGYHDGTGVITGAALSGYTSGTATAADVYLNKTIWVNGVKITGTMPVIGAQTATLNCGGSVTITKGYHNGNGAITVNTLASQTAATATAARVLKDRTCWVGGSKVTGAMANNGAQTAYLNAGGSVTIKAGYHNGSGVITANTLKSQTAATASAARVRSGYTCWVNGSKVTGSIGTQSAKTITPGPSNQTINGGVYLSGNIVMAGDADLIASNIKKGVKIFNITGTWEGLG